MDGFHLAFVSMEFADDQWRSDDQRILLAEQQRARLLEEAERSRRANQIAESGRVRNSRRSRPRDVVMAWRARFSATRRLASATPSDLLPAASETR